MKIDEPIPEFLKKRGITRVEDNLAQGQRVNVGKGVFMLFFGDELVARCTKVTEQNKGGDDE